MTGDYGNAHHAVPEVTLITTLRFLMQTYINQSDLSEDNPQIATKADKINRKINADAAQES